MTRHAKMAMPDLQQYPWNLYLINNVEEIVVFQVKKYLISIIPICFPGIEMLKSFLERTHFWKFHNFKHWYLIHTWLNKVFKVTVVNRTLPSLNGGSLEITLTVPLRMHILKFFLMFKIPPNILDLPFIQLTA